MKFVVLAPLPSGGAPNRPLPPTPDEEENGDRTLVMRRVSTSYQPPVIVHHCICTITRALVVGFVGYQNDINPLNLTYLRLILVVGFFNF